MKTIAKNLVLFLSLFFMTASCSKDDDNNGGSNNSGSRAVKYEITGNYSGRFTVVYTDGGGAMITEDITSLPWVKEFTAASNVQVVGFTAGSSHGGPENNGQTLAGKIYIGGREERTASATSNDIGYFSLNPQYYQF